MSKAGSRRGPGTGGGALQHRSTPHVGIGTRWAAAGRLAALGAGTLLAAALVAGPAAAAPGTTSVAAAGPPSLPVATSVPASAALAATQGQAAAVAAQLAADGHRLDQLAEQADAATIYAAQVDAQLAAARSAAARIGAQLAAARAALALQALAAYTGGADRSLVPSVASAGAIAPDLVATYGEILAGRTEDAITTYDRLRRSQAAAQVHLATAADAAHQALATLSDDRAAATSAQVAQQRLLSSLTGQMATLVAAAQARAAAQAAAQEQASLTAAGQALPQAAPAPVPAPPAGASRAPTPPPTSGTPAASPAPAAPTTVAARPAPTTAPRGTSPVTDAPTTAAPPTAAPPTAAPAPPGPPATAPATPGGTIPPQAPGAQAALAYARAQLGKPYQWAGAGPDSFDCSGLVMMAWLQGGVSFPHLAQDQYDLTVREPLSAALPGDLVFFGTPDSVHHVGIYVGGGEMIDAPQTGQAVQVQGIYWSDLLGAGRVVR